MKIVNLYSFVQKNQTEESVYTLNELKKISVLAKEDVKKIEAMQPGDVVELKKPFPVTVTLSKKTIEMKDTRNGFNVDVVLKFNRYSSTNNIHIEMIEISSGEPWTDVTVNQGKLDDHLINIKNYSENEGMYDLFVKAGIVESKELTKVDQSGMVYCKLTDAALAVVKSQLGAAQ